MSFVTLSLACSKVAAFAKKRPNSGEDLIAIVFVNCHVVGILAFLILLERSVNMTFSSNDFSFLRAVLWTMAGYSIMLLTFFLVVKQTLK